MKRMIWWVPIFTQLLLGGARPAGGQGVSQLNPLDSPDSQPAALQQSCPEANCSYIPLLVGYIPRLEVTYVYYEQLKYGGIAVSGAIKNNGAITVTNVRVAADLYYDSRLYETITGTTKLPAILPDHSEIFEMTSDLFADEVSARIISWEVGPYRQYLPLTVVSKYVTMCMLSMLTESGEIRNDQSVTLTNIVAEVSDGPYSDWHVASLGKTTLAPGETTTYSAGFYFPSNILCEDFSVVAYGEVQP